LTKSVIKQFEKGQREPKRDLVFKLAGILNVDMDYFTLQTGKKPSEDIAVSKGVVFDLTKEITEVSQALIFLEMKQLFFISKRGIMKLPLGEVLKFANEVRVSLLEIKKM
jgi:transcriptional regulator with XRE-family HTH domain